MINFLLFKNKSLVIICLFQLSFFHGNTFAKKFSVEKMIYMLYTDICISSEKVYVLQKTFREKKKNAGFLSERT